jgi:Flp pilus assembly protein CpaB
MRAVSIEVNEQAGVAGFIFPEHTVDIIQASKQGEPEEETETLLENVLVLAAGQATTRPEDKSIQVRTVTVAVTPEDAERVAGAKSQGPVMLSLRGLGDTAKSKKTIAAEASVECVFAARDIAANEPIDSEDLAVRRVPRNDVPPDAANAVSEIIGKRATIALAAKEMILKGRVKDIAGDAPEVVKVIAARHEIGAGHALEEADLETVEVPKEGLPSDVVQDAKRLVGLVTQVPLAKRELILRSKILEETAYRQVVVAAIPIPRGVRIHGRQVMLARLPRRELPADTVGDPAAVIGHWSDDDLEPGQPITRRHIKYRPTWARGGSPGFRVLTIQAAADHALDGQLMPGDFIDLFARAEQRTNASAPLPAFAASLLANGSPAPPALNAPRDPSEYMRDLVAECVRVLDCYPARGAAPTQSDTDSLSGGQVTGSRRPETPARAPEGAAESSLEINWIVTLQVPATDAVQIVEARTRGSLGFVVREPDDRGGFVIVDAKFGQVYHGFHSSPERFPIRAQEISYDRNKHRDKYPSR